MIQQGFHIGDRDWYIMVTYDIQTVGDLSEVEKSLLSVGCRVQTVRAAVDTLVEPDTGFTFTSFDNRLTLMFIGRATSAAQMYDTIQHELKHATEHISEYYHLDPKGERAAYLQGEIARQMFPAAALAVCPVCHCEEQ